jgi:nitrogen fixation-related uncharacterized protein
MYFKEVFVLLVAGVVLVSSARWGSRSEAFDDEQEAEGDAKSDEDLDDMIEQLEKSVLSKKRQKLEEQRRKEQRLQLKINKKEKEKAVKEKPAFQLDFVPNCKRWSLC